MLLQFCLAKEEKSAALDSFPQLDVHAITFCISAVHIAYSSEFETSHAMKLVL